MKLSTLYWCGAGLVAVLAFLVLAGGLDITRAVGGLFFGVGCLFMAHTLRVMARWTAVKAKVVHFTKDGDTMVTYSYMAGQANHFGTIDTETVGLGRTELNVYYNPDDPAESVVFSWLSVLLLLAATLLGLVLLILGPQIGG